MSSSELDSDPLFNIDAEEFLEAQEFLSYIQSHAVVSQSTNLNIILGTLDADFEDLTRQFRGYGWEIKDDLGVVKRISLSYSENRLAEGYLLHPEESDYFSFYTTQAKTEEVKYGIDKFLREHPSVTYLYLPARTLYKVASNLCEDSSGRVEEFIAKNPGETFNHYGREGFGRLSHFVDKFEALPYNLVIQKSNVRFRVDTAGRFKLLEGSLSTLLEWVDFCAQRSLNIRNEHQQSDLQIIDIDENTDVQQNMRFSEPATIDHVNPLTYEKAQRYQNIFDSAEEDYVLLDYHVEEGSVYLNGTVYDPETNTSFRIRGDQTELRVLPMEEQSLKTFYRFVEFYQSNVKIDSEVEFEQ